ncbi:DUF2339 domain-containing protein [Flavobacterium sp. ANB]|uniref:DUF2339 domain-containing protein n=1 Tax=unclassified Flavobacterium TaxID=196869 RepID=UPI0012B7D2DC|nr:MULTISPECIES: DUF2339 domain-containing protein [unclassified Flavobacterium]MBF4517472.1 DUF2339 domain-containing protein [Flavobacterium sp. ANB]MTD72102.1 DUF2339 domain-containing protein [Flavobacterium sp. LC2016-13]
MEVFLLVVLFCLLIYVLNTIKGRFDSLEDDIKRLSKKIDLLKVTEKPIENLQPTPIPVIKHEEIKITPEQSKPIIPEPLKKEVPEEKISDEELEKIALSASIHTPPKPVEPKVAPKPFVPVEPEKSFWENFKEQNPDLEKFIGENLINKIGVLILVLGISYFVKYAIDKDWINEPARVGIGVLCGVLVMGIAHKLRKNYAAFSSVIVAGAIAIFYFTIGIAFHDYHLFNQTVAFSIMVVITAFSALVSLSYNRIELAVLSLIGGFAVPFMVSTGEGNYVVLFSYIIILNIGILAIAYYKKWNLVNVLAYLFTVLLYGGWLFKDISSGKPHYVGALSFGFAFYFIFILMNIINNIKSKGEFSKTQLTILASNTFLFYAAGMVILKDYHPEYRGLFTATIALLNLVYATFLYKKFGLDKKAVYLLIGLTLTFITLAIPIQFEGNYITLFWAAEAVLLLWLSQKSKISSYRFGSLIVHILMLFSLIMDWNKYYRSDLALNIIINPIFSTGIFASCSLFAVLYLLKKESQENSSFNSIFDPETYKNSFLGTGLLITYLTGLFEVIYQSNNHIESIYSAISLPILYHLLFSIVFSSFIIKKKTLSGYQAATVLIVVNIVLFAFWFSNYPFLEHKEIIGSGTGKSIAFYLHYVTLFITVYAAYQLFQISKKTDLAFFKNKYFIWVASFFIIYIASSEVMLHGLVFMNSPVTTQNIQASSMYLSYKNDLPYLRDFIADDFIDLARTKIIKTGFPILWGVLAFIFLIVGIKKQVKTLRIIALSLLGLTIVKLFFYDISNISETGKIISFILLGILILIISFVYQKIKVLVIDENKPTSETHEIK